MIPLIVAAGVAIVGLVLLFCYVVARAAVFLAVLSGAGLAFTYWTMSRTARRQLGTAPWVAALSAPLAAWLLPNLLLLYAAAAALVPVLAKRPGQIAALYLFSLLLLPGLDLTIATGSLKLFEFGVHDALACGAAAALLVRGRGPGRVALDLPFLAVLLLLVAATARDTSATNLLRVLVNTGLDYGLPYYIVSRGVRSRAGVRLITLHLAAAAAVLSLILLYEAHSSWPIYNALYPRYGIDVLLVVKSRGGVLRAGGPFLESTSIAMVLAMCFLAGWTARPAFRSGRRYAALLALLALGLIAPQSRGAWFGLLAGMAVVDLYRGEPGRLVKRLALVAAAGLCVVTIARGNERLAESVGLSGGSAETADYRQRLLDRGMEEFRKSPWIGYASADLLDRLADLKQGENIIDFVNTYVFVALIAGGIGLFVFVGAFVFYLWLLWRRRRAWRAAGPNELSLAAFAFGGLAMPMEMLFFTSFGGRPATFVFVFFAMSAALARLAPVQRRAVRRASVTPNIAPARQAAAT